MNKGMAPRQRHNIAAIAAAADTRKRQLPPPAIGNHQPLPRSDPGITEGKAAEAVVGMHVNSGIVEDKVGAKVVRPLMKRLPEGRQIGHIARAISQCNIKITHCLANGEI